MCKRNSFRRLCIKLAAGSIFEAQGSAVRRALASAAESFGLDSPARTEFKQRVVWVHGGLLGLLTRAATKPGLA